MAVRTTVDLPEILHDRLRASAEQTGTSMRALIVKAIEVSYAEAGKSKHVKGPLIRAKGKRGARYPKDENPYELIFP